MSSRRDLLHPQQQQQKASDHLCLPAASSSPRSRANSRAGGAVTGLGGCPQPPLSPLLHWSTGRRVCSEPGESHGRWSGSLLVDSGRSSLTSYGSSESLLFPAAIDSDVFSDCYTDDEDDEEEEIEEVPLSVYLQGKWKEWMVGSDEIQLYGETVSSCKETVQR